MEFKYFWDKQRKLEPNEPKYISICKIVQGSGEDREVLETIFDTYMEVVKDFDSPERKEMISYLIEISKDN